eukprot:GSMAST32.ASY1.ANO1.1699.1 assembled CDS
MGSFLDKPITSKEVHEEIYTEGGIHVTSASMQGYRISMEDAEICKTGIDGNNCMFGVFDGHGGDWAAKESGKRLLETQSPQSSSEITPEVFTTVFEKTMVSMDKWLLQQPCVKTGTDCSGTTACVTYITSDHIVCANVGDSRAVLCRQNADNTINAFPLSYDHKPKNPIETKRIVAAGGTVSMNRVNGDLAVSRALGDFMYKAPDLQPESQAIFFFEIFFQNTSPTDKFIVIACDGIWDVMTNVECISFLNAEINNGTEMKMYVFIFFFLQKNRFFFL